MAFGKKIHDMLWRRGVLQTRCIRPYQCDGLDVATDLVSCTDTEARPATHFGREPIPMGQNKFTEVCGHFKRPGYEVERGGEEGAIRNDVVHLHSPMPRTAALSSSLPSLMPPPSFAVVWCTPLQDLSTGRLRRLKSCLSLLPHRLHGLIQTHGIHLIQTRDIGLVRTLDSNGGVA